MQARRKFRKHGASSLRHARTPTQRSSRMRPVALLTVIAALASPAAALADKPSTPPSHPAKPAQAATPTVAYIVKGTVTGYTAANGATNGSLTITVTGSNHHAASMK